MLTLKMQYQTMKCDYSDREAILALYKRSFSEGVGSIMSLQGGDVALPDSSAKTDAQLLQCDWKRVGRDIRYAISKLNKSLF